MAITPPGAGTFTVLHLAVLALLILATLALIAVGVRRARARRAAAERVKAEAAALDMPEPAPAPLAASVAPAPTTEVELVHSLEPDPPVERSLLADEFVPAAAPMDAGPATVADPGPVDSSPSPSPADGPVTQLKGLGPKVAARLAELGLSSVGQIAALDADQAAAVDARLGPFAGRLQRDRWVEQARFLAAGDIKGFEAVFGRL